MRWRLKGTAIASFALLACSEPPQSRGIADSGAADGGELDAGPSTPDSGASANDAGAADAGSADAGTIDAGSPSASVPAVACSDSLAAVYVTPGGLPPLTDAGRGNVLRCAVDRTLSLAQVEAQVSDAGIATPMSSGTTLYRIAFRTERGDGTAGASTARVYLPQAPQPLPMPLVVIGHGTTGLAPACAPSEDPAAYADLALPWAGLGYAVIAPDYAGLGNEGTQGYLDNRDQAHSLLDGARALRKLVSPGAFSPQILAVGFSQGGGAVLSAQALVHRYGADGTLAGAIVFAPQWPTRLNSFGMVDQLLNPTELTILTGISEDVVSVMRTYAYFYNRVGPAHAGDGFPAAARAGIDGAVGSLCETVLGGYLQATAVHVGDITDPTLRTTLLACVQGGPAASGCVDPGASYYAFLEQNLLHADPTGAPVLYVQGLADIIMPPASEAACNIEWLRNDGLTPQVCIDSAGQHLTVTGRNMDFVLSWARALLASQPLPSCSSAGLPACTP